MTVPAPAVIALVAAVWVAASSAPSRRASGDRLAALRRPGRGDPGSPPAPTSSGPNPSSGARPVRREPDVLALPLRVAGAAGAGALVALMTGPNGPPIGAFAAVVAWLVLGRLEPSSVRRRRVAVERDLPFAVDLLATCLASGASLEAALRLVGGASRGDLGVALHRSASALALGAPPSEAVASWRGDQSLVALRPLARAVVRSGGSGTGLVAPLTRLADDLRSARRWRVDEVARRAGVRATAPLGLCFLPAFVLLGIVPVVLAGAASVGL